MTTIEFELPATEQELRRNVRYMHDRTLVAYFEWLVRRGVGDMHWAYRLVQAALLERLGAQ